MKNMIERAALALDKRVTERRKRIAAAIRETGVDATIRGEAVVIKASNLDQRLIDDADLRLAIGGLS